MMMQEEKGRDSVQGNMRRIKGILNQVRKMMMQEDPLTFYAVQTGFDIYWYCPLLDKEIVNRVLLYLLKFHLLL